MTDTDPNRASDLAATGQGEHGSKPQPAQVIPVAVEERSFVSLIPQFFIFPLLLVTIAVLVYVFFIAAAQDERPISDLLTDIRRSLLEQTRNRAAYELAMRARDLEKDGQRLSVDDTRNLISLLEDSADDADLRPYLVHAIGRIGEPNLVIDVLLKTLQNPENLGKEKERIEAIRGLGLGRSPRAVEPLIAELDRFQSAKRWEPRQIVLTSLANIALHPDSQRDELERIVKILESHLEDPHWLVRWNSAAILASSFRNSAGVQVLGRMLDRDYLGEHVSKTQDQDSWLVRAVDALEECNTQGFCTQVDKLSKDASFPVRNAALKYLQKVCTGSKST